MPHVKQSPSRHVPVLALVVFLSIVPLGCGADAEPAEPPVVVRPMAPDDPFAQVSREELYGATPVENLWSPRYELEVLELPRAWDGARFAILSDMHLGPYPENEQVAAAAVRRSVESGADVILLLGDFLAAGDDVSVLRRVLSPLRGRQAVAVLGTLDVRTDSIEARVRSALTEVGIQVLSNSAVAVRRQGEEIRIAGLDPDVIGRSFSDQQFILAMLGEAGPTTILLTHSPALATRSPMGGFPIVIGGNTFCGSVEVPGTPRLSWLHTVALPGASIPSSDRLFRVQGSTVVVACGLGYGFVPIRFGAAPEVPILTLLRVAPRAAVAAEEAIEDTLIQRFQGPAPDTL